MKDSTVILVGSLWETIWSTVKRVIGCGLIQYVGVSHWKIVGVLGFWAYGFLTILYGLLILGRARATIGIL